MNENHLKKTGENYLYLKTIVSNHIKLMKLDLIESTGKLLSLLVTGLLLIIFFSFSLISIFIAFTLYISNILDSTIMGLFISSGVVSFLGLAIYILREKIIFKPLVDAIYNHLYNQS
ncbi:MAG: hypothetical protein HKN68_10630 [Saprospiraceae bacterium]|nr:hypothetical protein [Saprospiraceae bacterium]